jgi:hypothetical protein
MRKAYQIAQEMVRDQLREHDPEAAADLDDIHESDILVTRGNYDFIEDVMKQCGTPCTAINPDALEEASLRPDQVLFVNCPGTFQPRALRRVETFVREGGFLFTTDWALKNVLETAFPGFVEYNQNPSGDEVVRVEILAKDDPYLATLLGPEDDPQWWLEGSSYPIRVLKPNDVEVLVVSKEIQARYGESPVLVAFEYGEGKIYHMISHFYLQRTETRTDRHRRSSMEYMKEKKMSPALRAKYEAMGGNDSSLAEVESAYSSSSLMNSILLEKKRRMREGKNREEKGNSETENDS